MTNEHFENSGYQPTESPILERLKVLEPEIDPRTVVSLDGVAECIGGFKSGKFNPDIVHRLRELGIPAVHVIAASGLEALAESFERAERLADSLYDIALERAQDAITIATAQGATPEMLLVPDSVNESAHDYCHRLARLAQDTGLPVTIHMWVEDHEGFTTMEPPTAPSVEAFYQAISTECAPFERPVYAAPMDANLLDQWGALINGELGTWPSYSNMQEALPILARHGTPEDLQAFFADPANSGKLKIIRDLAFGEENMLRHERESDRARHILAKLGDLELRRTIMREYGQKEGRYGYAGATCNPIGIYMRADDELFEDGKTKVLESLDADDDTDKIRDLYFYGRAIAFSQRFDVADWLAALPQLAPQAPRAQRRAYSYIVEHAPNYAAIVSTAPRSPEQIRSMATLKAFLIDTLGMFMQKEERELGGINYRPPTSQIADTLITFQDPTLRPLLEAHVRHFFEACGSVLIGEGMDKHDFMRHYLAYRKVYGPITDIDARIKITQS